MVRVNYTKQEVDYLTVLGRALTPNDVIYPAASITGPIRATTTTDWKGQPNFKELALNFKIGKEGTSRISGGLVINFLVIDPIEGEIIQSLAINSTPIAGPATVRFFIANGSATAWVNGVETSLGSMNVPSKWQVQLVLSGSNPFFPIEGTYEAKE